MLKEGSNIPSTVFKLRVRNLSNSSNPFEWRDMKTSELFGNKRIVLFALPGAFTPTCSSMHLPGYESMYDRMKDNNIDDVYCLSVNDAFVMRKWGLSQSLEEDKKPYSLGFKNVKLLPDGDASFTRGMGASCTWSSERGFGERSWRYSMVVSNGIIEKIFEEPGKENNSKPDPFGVSDATTMLRYLENCN